MNYQNKILIIGDDHNNTLGLVRSFGKNGIAPYGIIVGGMGSRGFACRSKYWEKVWYALDEEEALKIMWREFKDEKVKPVVFPCSDKCAMMLDIHLDALKENFMLPSIAGKQGEIAKLMNKVNQTVFAQQCGIGAAKSWDVDLTDEVTLPGALEFPCILKPKLSAEGRKADIEIAETPAETLQFLSVYKQKGYQNILIQKYINYEKEILVAGACGISDQWMIVMRKLRSWPIKKGSTSFGVREQDKMTVTGAEKIVNALMKTGYTGLFDIEFFTAKDAIYLNEINFRNSGASALACASGIHYAVYWYYQMIGSKKMPLIQENSKEWYYMNELLDFEYVRKKQLSYSEWKKNKKKAAAFAFYDKEDLLPCIIQPINRIQMKLRKNGA